MTPRGSGRPEPHASMLYAEPGTLGLLANIIPALITALDNIVSHDEDGVSGIISGSQLLFVGGIIQVTTGLTSFRRNDHLTGSAFIAFSSLWLFQGISRILTEVPGIVDLNAAVMPTLIGNMLVAVMLFVCSLFVNFIMPPVFIAMILTLVFETVALFYTWTKYIAAAFELIIVLTAVYAVVVMTTKGISQRYILPGFGNAPIDPLLIRRNVSGSKVSEQRKNTKYAEPMGLGYMGNVIPALLISFYLLGYFSDFRVAFVAVLCNSFLQIFAVYYSYLRHDFFYAIQFSVYLVFWLSKCSLPFLTSLGFEYPITVYFGDIGIILVVTLLTLLSVTQPLTSFVYNVLLSIVSVLSMDLIADDIQKYTFSVSSGIFCLATLYIATASLLNSIAEKPVFFVGNEIISATRIRKWFSKIKGCSSSDNNNPHHQVDSLMYLFNFIAAFALSSTISDQGVGTGSLPWLLSSGVLSNILCARLCYTAGSLARCFVLSSYAAVWFSWALQGIIVDDVHIRGSAVVSLVLHTFSLLMTTTFSKLWTLLGALVEILTVFLVLHAYSIRPSYGVLLTSLIVGLVSMYGMLCQLSRGLFNINILHDGAPFVQIMTEKTQEYPCPTFRSRMTSDLIAAAKLVDAGHVIGIPTDTVYALAGSCKCPESVSKIYHIKGRPPEKPICLCISSLDQLKLAKPPFSALLWRFMDLCYPGGITCVVRKGDWLRTMGVGDAVDFVGTKDSVAIRVPDSAVLSYLVSIAGPIAITSANPSGEPDSTHHDTVIDTLGSKLAGVVCDDESNESVASTVVNCINIDKGEITYFRIGCTPKEKVDALFEQAKSEILGH